MWYIVDSQVDYCGFKLKYLCKLVLGTSLTILSGSYSSTMAVLSNVLAGPFVKLLLTLFTVFVRVFAGAPAGCRILHEQTFPPVWAVITTWLTDTGQGDRQRWRGWERRRETDYHCVQEPPMSKATLRSALFLMLQLVPPSHCPTSGSACDSWVVLHAGNHLAGKHPSSKKKPFPTPPKPSFDDWTAHKCPVCVRHAVSKGLVQYMQRKTTLIWLMGRWQHTSHSRA